MSQKADPDRRSTVLAAMLARIAATVASSALLIAGAAAVFISDNGPGTAALLGAGLGVGILAILGERLESLRFGEIELRLRAAKLLAEAERAEEAGDQEAAGYLRASAFALFSELAPLARSYEQIRQTQAPGPDRTATLSVEVSRARDLASERAPSASMVSEMFEEGSDGMRVIALGLMQGSPKTADVSAVISAISQPRSDFEQFHALLVADQLAAVITPQAALDLRRVLASTISSGTLRPGGARWLQATKALRVLADRHGPSSDAAPGTSGD